MSAVATVSPASLSSSTFYRPCWAEINVSALTANWRELRRKLSKNVEMLAVVKANGYGVGAVAASKIAVDGGAAYLGVSSAEEGIALREAGFKIPILILGSLYPFENFALLFNYRLTPTIASLEAAAALDQLAQERKEQIPVHLKIDSGFGRIGVSIHNAAEFIQAVAHMSGIQVEGIYTHFASSDIDPAYTTSQTGAFMSVVAAAREQGLKPRWIHMANSSALIRFPATHGTLVRPGIAFYGASPFPGSAEAIHLEPVVTWKSRVIFLKTVPEGSPISYARTWTAKRPTRVATLAVGYADGLPRIISNKGSVLLGGRRVPILGRVTMDMTMVDVTDLAECRIGDEAVLLGRQGTQEITANEMAEWAETNAYEILCGIGSRVPRLPIGRQG